MNGARSQSQCAFLQRHAPRYALTIYKNHGLTLTIFLGLFFAFWQQDSCFLILYKRKEATKTQDCIAA
jgi:hypothetical protein